MIGQTPPIARDDMVKLYRQALASGVPLTKLEEKIERLSHRTQVAQAVESTQVAERVTTLKNRLPKAIRVGAALVPLFFIMVGMGLVGNALLPFAQYYFVELPQIQASTLTSPLPPEQVLDANPIVIAQAQASTAEGPLQGVGMGESTKPIILDTKLDFTNLSNWFGETELSELEKGAQEEEVYYIDIPSVDVTNAEVRLGGVNLNKSLIQYPGTAAPGEPGAPVIFGHSVLRQFYNPSEKNPRRYNSIFSYIMTLKKGDEIFVTYKGVRYRYLVQDRAEVKPTDVHILTQKYDTRQIKLVTCYPEGSYKNRGVITAVLVPN
ncbi:MAG TPA: sortase [Vitreimonas sp.]|nr:sortase [Vitreimonas sp.]